jgi:hypothetical protein
MAIVERVMIHWQTASQSDFDYQQNHNPSAAFPDTFVATSGSGSVSASAA